MSLLVLVLSLNCYAADDAPVLLKAGDPAPVAGVLLPDALAVLDAQKKAACREEVADLRKAVLAAPPPLAVVLSAVGGVLLAGAVVAGLSAGGVIKWQAPAK